MDGGGGVFAYNDPSGLLGFGNVQGEVWLWGRVEEHEHGYRAEYAYPKQIWAASPHAVGVRAVSQGHLREVAAHYGVSSVNQNKEYGRWILANIVARFTSSRSKPPSPPRWSGHPPYGVPTTLVSRSA